MACMRAARRRTMWTGRLHNCRDECPARRNVMTGVGTARCTSPVPQWPSLGPSRGPPLRTLHYCKLIHANYSKIWRRIGSGLCSWASQQFAQCPVLATSSLESNPKTCLANQIFGQLSWRDFQLCQFYPLPCYDAVPLTVKTGGRLRGRNRRDAGWRECGRGQRRRQSDGVRLLASAATAPAAPAAPLAWPRPRPPAGSYYRE